MLVQELCLLAAEVIVKRLRASAAARSDKHRLDCHGSAALQRWAEH